MQKEMVDQNQTQCRKLAPTSTGEARVTAGQDSSATTDRDGGAQACPPARLCLMPARMPGRTWRGREAVLLDARMSTRFDGPANPIQWVGILGIFSAR